MNDRLIGNEKNILFYNDEDGNTKVEVLLENELFSILLFKIFDLFYIKQKSINIIC